MMEKGGPVGASVRTEGTNREEELKVSDKAVAYMSSTEPAELQKCVFADSLLTLSEGGKDLGKFNVTVEFASRGQQPCMLLHAQSQGAIDGSPCGTTVSVYLATDLEVLEEDYHEYVKLEGHSLDKRCHMVQCDGRMVINRVATVGKEVTRESVSYPMSVLGGLVTAGSELLLMRLFALRRKVPENMNFVSLDQGLHITPTTFSELGVKQLEVGGEAVEVFGVERTIHSVADNATTWQSFFLADGHLASRVQVGSPTTMRLLQLPSQQQKGNHQHSLKTVSVGKQSHLCCLAFVFKGFEKIPLVWEEDMQMCSNFLDRKAALKADHASYLRQHPEIRALISDFLKLLLLKKPDDVIQFAREYFLQSSSNPQDPA
ncbi:ciliogenesis-associated TTC17-interacting protein isoform X1 [Halichoeres trimaculatus]|uniref:ciliogenesis-associated TTC17-interacting protein isoform X1 n=1 Tax=Halichoeres trimaculatus TaxID=147232 RepID=UPI003D9E7DC1